MFFSSNNNTAFAQQSRQILDSTQNVTITNATNSLSLTGTTISAVKPDKVTISLGVETANKTADAVLAATNEPVLDRLKTASIKDNETGTSSFSISPNYNHSQPSSSRYN